MSGHTPGPWIAQPDPDSHDPRDWVIGIEDQAIDYIATCWGDNARLIAAAPELLAACRAMVASRTLIVDDVQLIRDMHAAIQKATQP